MRMQAHGASSTRFSTSVLGYRRIRLVAALLAVGIVLPLAIQAPASATPPPRPHSAAPAGAQHGLPAQASSPGASDGATGSKLSESNPVLRAINESISSPGCTKAKPYYAS